MNEEKLKDLLESLIELEIKPYFKRRDLDLLREVFE